MLSPDGWTAGLSLAWRQPQLIVPSWVVPRGILGSMSNPHVEVLSYEFVSLDDRHDFSQAAAWQGSLGGFCCRLDSGRLEARPQAHYPTVQSAREALAPHLRAWELRSELENPNGLRIQFKPSGARMVDTTSGAVFVELGTAMTIETALPLTVKLGHHSYPPPSPKVLAPSPLVEELLQWVRDLREGRLPMLVLAYLFLTRLEFEYGGRDQALAALNVAKRVLRKLGELSAKNDPSHRRKVKGPVAQLAEAERQWVLAALPRLAEQAAEVASGSQPPQLTMADLPSL
jgi:hypothetical protein